MNKIFMTTLILISFQIISFQVKAEDKIVFKSSDGLKITADLYVNNPENSPFIILFHQARWSRGEYQEIAPKLSKLGFNSMAIDQRSGGKVNGVINETHLQAIEHNLPTAYTDAEADMNSAIDYVKTKFSKASKLIIWGSSYSSALVLKIAGERDDIDGTLSFAPGEYFPKKGKNYITKSAMNITKPVFITSAKNEKDEWWEIYNKIPSSKKTYFLPNENGQHGSRALWEQFPEHKAYWNAVFEFLETI
jgi:dienelactone hydrolase